MTRHLWAARLLIVPLSLTLLLMSGAPVAAGGGPVRYAVTPAGLTFDLPAPYYCSTDDVQLAVTASREYEMDFATRPDGATMSVVSGYVIETFTNLATGQTMTVNASGPLQATFYPDGSARWVAEGQVVVVQFGGGITLVRGAFDVLTGQFHGTSTNLCAALGA